MATITRQIILDTETTGLSPAEGHRVIEIGCVELINRQLTGNNYHQYFNPECAIDAGAVAVHGLTSAFLVDKPKFAATATELLNYLTGAELIIHNAAFDVGFLNHEFKKCSSDFNHLEDHCQILDTLLLARKKHPGQQNSLDALCKRYRVDNSTRQLHGALLDAQLLAQIYLAMTGGQVQLFVESESQKKVVQPTAKSSTLQRTQPLLIIPPTAEELAAHQALLQILNKASGGKTIWRDEQDG